MAEIEQEEERFELGPSATGSVDVRTAAIGSHLRLRDGSTATVTGNPADGMWLVCLVDRGDGEEPEEDAMVLCYDVLDYAQRD